MHKILLHNVGYFRGMNGSFAFDVAHALRFFYCSPNIQREAIGKWNELVEHERPDLAFLVEVNQGSLDNGYLNQATAAKGGFSNGSAFVKYDPKTLWERIWFFAGKSNACFANGELETKPLYLSKGVKRLVIEAHHRGITFFLVHLAVTRRSARERQMRELADRVSAIRGPVVVCGDFNIFGGPEELASLTNLGLTPVALEPTYPSAHPTHPHDLFLVSSDLVSRARTRVIRDTVFSDHLPVILELD